MTAKQLERRYKDLKPKIQRGLKGGKEKWFVGFGDHPIACKDFDTLIDVDTFLYWEEIDRQVVK